MKITEIKAFMLAFAFASVFLSAELTGAAAPAKETKLAAKAQAIAPEGEYDRVV